MAKGVEELNTIVQKDPHNAKVWMLIARAYFEREKYGEGLSLLEKALTYEPKNLVLLNMAGEASAYGGDNNRALKYFKESLGIDPDQENIKMKIRSLSSNK